MPLYVEVVRDSAGRTMPPREHVLPNDEATRSVASAVARSLSKPAGLVDDDDDYLYGEVEFYDEQGCLIISLSYL